MDPQWRWDVDFHERLQFFNCVPWIEKWMLRTLATQESLFGLYFVSTLGNPLMKDKVQ